MNAKMLVQSLKDSKAQVVLAFLFAGHAMDIKELRSWTGLKRQTLYNAVDSLDGMGLLGHQVLAHGRTVWLPAGELLPLFQMSVQRTPEIQMSPNRTPIVVVGESNLELSSITTITTTIDQQSPKRTPDELAALKVALGEHNIIGKKRAQLIACEWVSADYVRAHVEAAKSEHWDQPVGMAITRMLDQVPMPAKRENGHPVSCKCTTCKVDDFLRPNDKYISGAYADLIEH